MNINAAALLSEVLWRPAVSGESAVRHASDAAATAAAAAAACQQRRRRLYYTMDVMFGDKYYSLSRRHLSSSNTKLIVILIVMSFYSNVICVNRPMELPVGKSNCTFQPILSVNADIAESDKVLLLP